MVREQPRISRGQTDKTNERKPDGYIRLPTIVWAWEGFLWCFSCWESASASMKILEKDHNISLASLGARVKRGNNYE